MTTLLATDSGIRYIYALKGTDDRVHYVGQTNDPDRRLEQHRHAVESTDDAPLATWIRSLADPPTMAILETVDTGRDTAKVNAAERHWIKTLHAAGEPLTNTVGVPGRPRRRAADCRVVGYDVPLLTFEDVASRLAVSISTVRRLAAAGYFDAVRLPANRQRTYLTTESVGIFKADGGSNGKPRYAASRSSSALPSHLAPSKDHP